MSSARSAAVNLGDSSVYDIGFATAIEAFGFVLAVLEARSMVHA